jgi:hypothetical protein
MRENLRVRGWSCVKKRPELDLSSPGLSPLVLITSWFGLQSFHDRLWVERNSSDPNAREFEESVRNSRG